MATINLSNDAYSVSGTTVVDEFIPTIIPAGTAANTYVLPGDISVPTGATFPGYQIGTKFTVINLSSNTQTFSAPSGYTLSGTSSITTGAVTPTRVIFFYVGNKTWAGF